MISISPATRKKLKEDVPVPPVPKKNKIISDIAKEWFCKDYNLPILIYKEPYELDNSKERGETMIIEITGMNLEIPTY